MRRSADRRKPCSSPIWRSHVKSHFRTLIACWVVLAPMANVSVIAQAPQRQPPLFTWEDGLLAGVFLAGTYAVRPLDKSAATYLQGPGYQKNQYLKATAAVVRNIALPGAFIIGPSLYAAGR